MKLKKMINDFVTCEVRMHGKVSYFAKLASGQWVAVSLDGSLDPVEISPTDFESMLETVEGIGADVRFTNHSAV